LQENIIEKEFAAMKDSLVRETKTLLAE